MTELILVTLSNGDVALFVNGHAVLTLEASEKGESPAVMGDSLAQALGIELQVKNIDVPSDQEWTWDEVYQELQAEKLGASISMGEPSNSQRAGWAKSAVDTFATETGLAAAGEDMQTTIGDLLCNLMHLCEQEQIDFERTLAISKMHYDAESYEAD